MGKPNITVIVPVYNVEKYLSKCIDSILAQTYTDFELILIDDGSPDNSGVICDEYASQDSRIHVIHKPNGGVSSARNAGLDAAQGEWIAFVDADDCLDSKALEICSDYFGGYDIVRFSMRLYYNADLSEYRDIEVKENQLKNEYISNLLSRRAILGVCGGIYKRSLFENNNIRFDEDIISGEDWLVQTKVVLRSASLKTINKPLYFYNRFVEESCTNKFRFEVHYTALNALERINNLLTTESKKIYNKELLYARYMLVYDFLASKIRKKQRIAAADLKEYRLIADVKLDKVLSVEMPMKWRVLLFLYLSPFRRAIFGE